MTTIYLVRHATYTEKHGVLPGRLPVELSPKGIEEAKKLKQYFMDKNITKIYSSEVLRCKQTSEIISDNEIAIEYDKRLLEGLSAYQGFWDPYAWDKFWGYRHILGGESKEEVGERMLDFFNNTEFKQGNNYIICSHGDPIYFLYEKVSNVAPLQENEVGNKPQDPPDYPQKGSIKIIKRKKDEWYLEDTITQDML